MDIRRVPGSGAGETCGPWWTRFGLACWSDWSSLLFWDVNWSDFVLLHVGGEIEWMLSDAEFEVAALGFHLQLTYYWPSEERERLKETVRGIECEEMETVSFTCRDRAGEPAPEAKE